jgi:hypothetical protein
MPLTPHDSLWLFPPLIPTCIRMAEEENLAPQGRGGSALPLWCWCSQRLLLLCSGFGDQLVGMAVNELPGIAFAAKEFGHAQVERHSF